MSESQKETFRKYLEASGALDNLVKVLVSLYEEPEKPKQALDYMKAALGAPTPADYEAAVAERDGLRKQLEDAQLRIAELENKLQAQ